MIEEFNKKPEEFELKYILDNVENSEYLFSNVISVLVNNGFNIVSMSNKKNNDDYYDTFDLDLYNSGGSLRIRKTNKGGKEVIKCTCKIPYEKGTVYSSRYEIEDVLCNDKFDTFKNKMISLNVPINFDKIKNVPVINSLTNRSDVVLEKNGVEVCLSFDNTRYINYDNCSISKKDCMIEIEAIGKLNNRVILNDIHDIITSNFDNLIVNKQNKYERGINCTKNSVKKLIRK